jgi:hypothetical protein
VREGVVQEQLGRLGVPGDDPRNPQPTGEVPVHDLQALACRSVDEVFAVQVQEVEEERGERRRPPLGFDVDPAGETAPGGLERVRPAVGPKRDRLSVQDRRLERQAGHRVNDLGHPIGDVGQCAGERPHLPLQDVDLQPDAVELPLDVGGMDPIECVGRVRRGLREHRVHGPKDGEAESPQPRLAPGDGRGRHGAQVALEHERPAHVRSRNAGRGGHAFDHAPLESTLSQLADQEAG